jgi:predicted nucleic acid-binding protein
VNVFADSSALAKRYIADEKSEHLDKLLEKASSLAVSSVCLPEIISALCRRVRERLLTKPQYLAAKAALEADLEDASVIALIDEVLLGAVGLLEAYPLRASDAIQISSALVWGADEFVSADSRQCAAARSAGLKVVHL